MISPETLRPGQDFLLTETLPGHDPVEAAVVYLRSNGPALLFKVVWSTDQETFPRGDLIVRIAGSARRWELRPLDPAPKA